MSRSSDPVKLAAWRERLERFSSCGLAVTRFCAREGVSAALFYHWRKKLGANGRRGLRPLLGPRGRRRRRADDIRNIEPALQAGVVSSSRSRWCRRGRERSEVGGFRRGLRRSKGHVRWRPEVRRRLPRRGGLFRLRPVGFRRRERSAFSCLAARVSRWAPRNLTHFVSAHQSHC